MRLDIYKDWKASQDIRTYCFENGILCSYDSYIISAVIEFPPIERPIGYVEIDDEEQALLVMLKFGEYVKISSRIDSGEYCGNYVVDQKYGL